MSSEAIAIEMKSNKGWYMLVSAFAIAVDQITKFLVTKHLSDGGEIAVIKNFFVIAYTENRGIAFGMFGEYELRWLLAAVSFAAILLVLYYLLRVPASSRLLLWSLALLAGGIAGNLIDRVRLGRVVDFFEFFYRDWHFPVFNVADTVITIGAALMAIELFASSSHPTKERDDEFPLPESANEIKSQNE